MSSISSAKVGGGKLTFKGQKVGKSRSSKAPSHHKRKLSYVENDGHDDDGDDLKILGGAGRITSSATTVHGHDTKFMTELSPGDAIIIVHPTTLLEETKIVRMVLSNVSMGISSPFSTDLVSTTQFKYIKAPKDHIEEEAKEQATKVTKQKKMEEEAFGTYASSGGEKFVYRVKKDGAFGGYKIMTEDLGSSKKSREELLDMRTKKKSDRFCY